MPSKSNRNRTNLSRNSGAMVPSSVSGGPGPGSVLSSPTKKKKPKAAGSVASSRVSKRKEETRPLDIEDDNVSDVSDGDPIDNYDLAEGEVDDEPRFKYSTADLADRSPRSTTCCIATMCVLCLILAIGLSVMMVKVADKKRAENEAPTSASFPPMPTSSNSSTAGADIFTESKELVNLNCEDPTSDTCSETCKDFDCCDPAMNELAGCFFGNREGCINYSRCHVTNSGMDPPTPNLEALCSQSKVASDPSGCENACRNVKCCWEDTSSCVDNFFYSCLDYGICQNLRDDLKVPLPIDGLEEFCSDEVVGGMAQRDECFTACEIASCCWDATTDNCLQDNFFTCLMYEPCGEFDFPEAFSVVPEPGVDTSLVCSTEYRAEKGQSECEAACNLSTCCRAAPGENCFQLDPLGCIKYDGCKLLALE